MAERDDDPWVEQLIEEAQARDVHILMGATTHKGMYPGDLYNSVLVIGPSGLVGVYSKTHVAAFTFDGGRVAGEKAYWSPGFDLAVFDTPLGRIGVEICYDIMFPEVARTLALKGAELIVNVSAAVCGFEETWDHLLFARSAENSVWYLHVSVVGLQKDFELFGGSRLFSPSGEVIAEAPRREEAILTASASRDALLEARGTMHTFYNRNPRLYAPIADTEPPVPMSSPPCTRRSSPPRGAGAGRGHRPREEQTNARGHRRIRRPAVHDRDAAGGEQSAARRDASTLRGRSRRRPAAHVPGGECPRLDGRARRHGVPVDRGGWPPVLPNGEVDGLLGTAALARVLCLGCRANVVILTEARVEEPLRAACQGAGLNFVTDGPEMANSVHFVPMPVGDEACRSRRGPLAADPVAVVTVEKLSPNDKGVIHGVTGISYHDVHANPKYIVDGARSRGSVSTRRATILSTSSVASSSQCASSTSDDLGSTAARSSFAHQRLAATSYVPRTVAGFPPALELALPRSRVGGRWWRGTAPSGRGGLTERVARALARWGCARRSHARPAEAAHERGLARLPPRRGRAASPPGPWGGDGGEQAPRARARSSSACVLVQLGGARFWALTARAAAEHRAGGTAASCPPAQGSRARGAMWRACLSAASRQRARRAAPAASPCRARR